MALVLPVAFVAYDILQIFVRHNVVFAHDFAGVVYHLSGQSNLPCHFNGKGTARVAYLEHEQGLHLVAVVEHGAVDDRLLALGIQLKVLIVCGNNAMGACRDKVVKYAFGQSTADLWFGAAAKFVYEQ